MASYEQLFKLTQIAQPSFFGNEGSDGIAVTLNAQGAKQIGIDEGTKGTISNLLRNFAEVNIPQNGMQTIHSVSLNGLNVIEP